MAKNSNAPVPIQPDDDASGARGPLTAERIVGAAIELMDQEGMAALTMRKLGARLSVQAMSLYGYFPNKEALLAAAKSALFAKIRDADAAHDDAVEGLRAVMTATYRLVEEHPSFVDLLFRGPPVPAWSYRGETDLAALRSLGFTQEEASYALQSLLSFVIGCLHQARLITPEQRSAAFTFGLDIILDGLRRKAQQRAQIA